MNCRANKIYRGEKVTVFLPSLLIKTWVVCKEIYPGGQRGWVRGVVAMTLTVRVQGHEVNRVGASESFHLSQKFGASMTSASDHSLKG